MICLSVFDQFVGLALKRLRKGTGRKNLFRVLKVMLI